MDPTESIRNLTFSLSVQGAAPVLKADALTKKQKKKRREVGSRGQERQNIIRNIFTIPKGYSFLFLVEQIQK